MGKKSLFQIFITHLEPSLSMTSKSKSKILQTHQIPILVISLQIPFLFTLYKDYTADLYIYFVDKNTKQPPETYDTTNLKSYTYQIRLETRSSNLQFISSFFDDSYQVPRTDWFSLNLFSSPRSLKKIKPT